MEMKDTRIGWIDELRGLAIWAMIIHHIAFNLVDILGLSLPWLSGILASRVFAALQTGFVAIFLGLSGLCSHLTRRPLLRVGKVALGAAAVTIATRLVFPDQTIWFGVLHCLAVCMLLFTVLGKYMKKIPPVWGLCACILLFLITYRLPDGYVFSYALPRSLYTGGLLTVVGFPSPYFESFDYVPLLPHIFLFSAGAFLGSLQLPRGGTHCRPLAFCGRHSLLIYLLHQPVLFGIFLLLEKILKG